MVSKKILKNSTFRILYLPVEFQRTLQVLRSFENSLFPPCAFLLTHLKKSFDAKFQWREILLVFFNNEKNLIYAWQAGLN